jgi:hypothetical protein
MQRGDPYAAARDAADDLRRRGFDDHDVLLVLGSGRIIESAGGTS